MEDSNKDKELQGSTTDKALAKDVKEVDSSDTSKTVNKLTESNALKKVIVTELLDKNNFDFTNINEIREFRLPKFFIGIFAASIMIIIGCIGMFIYSTIEVKKKDAERITLAGQNTLISERIESARREVVELNTAGEIKDIWLPLIERRISTARVLEKTLAVIPSNAKLESLSYEVSRLNLARITLRLKVGVVADTQETAGLVTQKLRTDVARHSQLTVDSNETRFLSQTPVQYQGSDRQMFNTEEIWNFSVNNLSESELINLFNRLNRSHPIR